MRAKRASFILVFSSFLISLPLFVSAAEFKAGEVYAVPRSETVFDDLYAAGGTITLSGSVGDDLRAAGGRIQVAGKVGDDSLVAGGQVYFVSGSSVEGDVIVSGGRVIMDAGVGGRVKIVAREVTLNGPVAGDVDIAADRIVVGEKAAIGGNFTYKSLTEAEIRPGAIIKGTTAFEKIEAPAYRARMGAFLAAWVMARYLMLLTAALIAVRVFKRLSQGVMDGALGHFGRELVTGFVVLIVVPAAVLVSFLTVIGTPIGLAGLLAYFLLFVVSSVYAGVVLGGLIQKVLFKKPAPEVNWKTALLGVTVYSLAGIIPVLGWLFKLAFFLTAFGILSRTVYEKAWVVR
jgi:cytoskeletal protein CcmA (bactofilin family)